MNRSRKRIRKTIRKRTGKGIRKQITKRSSKGKRIREVRGR